jgi:hypothetical protein
MPRIATAVGSETLNVRLFDSRRYVTPDKAVWFHTVRLLIGWLSSRQPRILDYILIAVITTVLGTAVVAVASGVGQQAATRKQTSTSPLRTSSSSSKRIAPRPQDFYAPDRNISCVLETEGAQCSVVSAGLTMVIPPDGGRAYTVPGLSVPLGSGSEAPFGAQRSNGFIVCDIPPEDVPAGVTCRDIQSGHGFEASRLEARRSVY